MSQSGGLPPPKEQKLPLALEKVLAFKDVRVSQVGMKPEDLEKVEKGWHFLSVAVVCFEVLNSGAAHSEASLLCQQNCTC
jgi:hypothetical protein